MTISCIKQNLLISDGPRVGFDQIKLFRKILMFNWKYKEYVYLNVCQIKNIH